MTFQGILQACRDNHDASLTEDDGVTSKRSVTFAGLHERATGLAERLTRVGLRQGHIVGIAAQNSIAWVVWDLACMMVGAVLKPFPPDIDLAPRDDVLRTHRLALMVTDDPARPLPHGWVDVDVPELDSGCTVAEGAEAAKESDVHSMVYSSGSSGRPKGLLMSRSGSEYFIERFIDSFAKDSTQHRHVMFLPLFGYQQRLTLYGCLAVGASLVFAPYQRVFQVMARQKPTFIIAPPVFYDTLLQLHDAGALGPSLPTALGGALRFAITGMAPIALKTLKRLEQLGIPVFEVYGMNECGMVSWNTESFRKPGTVGKPIEEGQVIIEPDGEIVVRRALPLSLGYFDADVDDQQATFRSDGLIATGDLGAFDGDGYLSIVGRKKDVVVLPSGQKFHPAISEASLAGIEGVREVVLVYDPLGTQVVAVIVPVGGSVIPEAELCRRVKERNNEMVSHQRFSRLIVHPTSIGGDARFLTRNLKLNRRAVYDSLVQGRIEA